MTFSVGSSTEIKNPYFGSHAWFPQFRVDERFCIEGSNKRSDRGEL